MSPSQPFTRPMRSKPQAPFAGPVLVWAALSMGALAIFALQLPLWANPPRPPERIALWGMAGMQVILLSLLFPWLLSTPRAALSIGVGSALMLELSGLLADAPTQSILAVMVGLWGVEVVLFTARRYLASPCLQQIGVTLLTSALLGGLVLGYFSAEFGTR